MPVTGTESTDFREFRLGESTDRLAGGIRGGGEMSKVGTTKLSGEEEVEEIAERPCGSIRKTARTSGGIRGTKICGVQDELRASAGGVALVVETTASKDVRFP